MIDPKKAIHLVYSDSGRGNLEYYFKTNFPNEKIKIHSIFYDLTTGPLSDFTSFSDCEEYISYLKILENVFNYDDDGLVEDYFQPQDFIDRFKIDFSKETPLIIWHGNETGEKLMLYRYCHLLKDRDLYEINLENWSKHRCLPEINPKDMDGILNLVKKIDENSKVKYAQEWERLKNDKKTNRILKDRKIISVEEDYYDQNILDNCTSEYKNAARVVGETMGQQETSVGDYYLFYRVHLLINQNLLEGKGNLNEGRYFEIRKK